MGYQEFYIMIGQVGQVQIGVLLYKTPGKVITIKQRKLTQDCCSCNFTQFVSENVFVFVIKEIVASRIFRLLSTLYFESPNRSISQKDLSSKFRIRPGMSES